jgi:predicted phosphohydrolase
MKVYLISDLHCELLNEDNLVILINKIMVTITNPLEDILLLPGDIGDFFTENRINNFYRLMLIFGIKFNKIIWILGNHEYYHSSINKTYNDANLLNNKLNIYFDTNDKFILLINQSYEINNYVILGTTLWANANLNFDPNYINPCIKWVNDFSISKEQHNIQHKNDLDWLTNEIDKYRNTDKKIIVMTHHLPSYKLIDPEYKIYTNTNSYFATDLEYLFGQDIKYWFYGHTHTPNDVIINSTNLIVNPLGYEKESQKRLRDDNIFKVIDLVAKDIVTKY